jgi:hypothetical protein
VHALLDAGCRRYRSASPLAKDAVLYLLAAFFAAITAFVARSADYRQWGAIAAAAYGAGALVCLIAFVRYRPPRLASASLSWLRRGVVLFLLVGAVLVPLGLELAWRAQGGPGGHAQPEVAVIERAGDRAAHGLDPYLAHPSSVGIPPTSDASGIDAKSFFPYLPAMVPFGMLNAVPIPTPLRDARVALAGFTLVVVGVALAVARGPLEVRGRVLQFLVILPSGALPMVTGGDDLPVLALLLVGLLLAERRRPLASGLVLGLAAALKFTAWPLLVLLSFSIRDNVGRPAVGRYALAALAIVVPVIGAGILASPAAFLENVVRFPLGLTKVRSPAASPLLGQVLVHAFPHDKALVTASLLALGALGALGALIRRPPRTPASAAYFAAFVMALATLLAPATRFGYLIYPVNLVAFGILIGSQTRGLPEAAGQVSSPRSTTRRETELVGAVCPSPESAGLIDGMTGSTFTPTSQ